MDKQRDKQKHPADMTEKEKREQMKRQMVMQDFGKGGGEEEPGEGNGAGGTAMGTGPGIDDIGTGRDNPEDGKRTSGK